MSHVNAAPAIKITADQAVSTARTPSTKDLGRVKLGGTGIHFDKAPASTKFSGKVRLGGTGIRF